MSKRIARLFLCVSLSATAALPQGPAPAITSTSPLPTGAVSSPYSYQFTQANCGSCSWALFSGTLPPGLSLSSSGVLSGNPAQAGTFNFVIDLGPFDGPLTKAFQLVIHPAATLTIVNQNQLPPVTALTNYSLQLIAINGIGALTWGLVSGTLPPGVTLRADTGVLSGIPQQNGTYEFTIDVTDAQGRNASKFFVLFVRPALLFNDPSPLPNGRVGVPYSVFLDAEGGVRPFTYTFVSGMVPPGLTYNAPSSVLNGSPLTPGTYSFVIRVTDAESTVTTKTFELTVLPGLAITTASLPDATLNSPYTHTMTGANGVPPYVWAISASDRPPGLTLASNGVLSGTPTALGVYSMNVRLTDAGGGATSKQLTLTVRDPSGPGLVTSADSLGFSAIADGENPPEQFLAIVSTDSNRVPYTATVQSDGDWLRPRPLESTTPARMQVGVVTDGLAPGRYTGRITITGGGRTIPVDVVLELTGSDPALEVSPAFLRFLGTPSAIAGDFQQLTISSRGSARLPFTTSVNTGAPWLTVTPSSAEASKGAPALARVAVNPDGLQPGSYRGVVVVDSAFGREEVPVTLLIAPSGAAINVPASGRFFDLRAGAGRGESKAFVVQGLGDQPVPWRARILNGDEWLRISPTQGQAETGRPDAVTVTPDPGSLAPGVYYALVEVSSEGAYGSPQYVVCVMRLRDPSGSAVPDPSPQGLLFTAGGQPQDVQLSTSSAQAVPYQAGVSTADGADWLSVTPANGSTSSGAAAAVSVAVNATGLTPGVYSGDVTFSFASVEIRTVNVTLIVPPAVTAASKDRAAAGCTPSKLAMVHTGSPNGFSTPAGWPVPIGVRVADDCAEGVNNASVTVTFSNGDPAISLKLADPSTSFYAGTWTPQSAGSQVLVSARASAAGLAPAVADVIGGVATNEAPVVAANGTLNNLNPALGAPVAPGTIVAIYGSNLASVSEQTNQLPLAAEHKGTRVIIGGRAAPLYYVSPGQINAHLPTELDPNAPQAVIVQAGSAFAQPELVALTPASPGVASYGDGNVIAQRNDYSLITPASPARSGDGVILYLVGMGATATPVTTGQASPGDPLPSVTAQPQVTIGGKTAVVAYAGLTPGAVGLYQINLTVPDLPAGTHKIVITQNGAAANETNLVVQ